MHRCEDYDEDINNNYHKIPSTALQDAIIRDITRKKSEETKECREQENLIDLILVCDIFFTAFYKYYIQYLNINYRNLQMNLLYL